MIALANGKTDRSSKPATRLRRGGRTYLVLPVTKRRLQEWCSRILQLFYHFVRLLRYRKLGLR